jgi:hypothetical protein
MVEFFILVGDVVNLSFCFLPTSFTKDEAKRLLLMFFAHVSSLLLQHHRQVDAQLLTIGRSWGVNEARLRFRAGAKG